MGVSLDCNWEGSRTQGHLRPHYFGTNSINIRLIKWGRKRSQTVLIVVKEGGEGYRDLVAIHIYGTNGISIRLIKCGRKRSETVLILGRRVVRGFRDLVTIHKCIVWSYITILS